MGVVRRRCESGEEVKCGSGDEVKCGSGEEVVWEW